MPQSTAEPTAELNGDDTSVALIEEATLGLRTSSGGKTHLSLAELEQRVAHYPESVRPATCALQAFYVQHCDSNVDQLRGFAENTLKFKRSPEYFSNWLKGHYFRGAKSGHVKGEGLTQWIDFCERVLEHDRLTKAGGKLGTIVTPTIRAVEVFLREIMDPANPCRIGGIAGPTGAQKTMSAKYVCAKLGGFPHANYMDCRESYGLGGFKYDLADAFNCKVGNKAGFIDREIARQLNSKRLLVVDNIQRAFREERDVQVIFEYVIRLQERTDCAMLIYFTREFFDQRLSKGEAAGYFEQLVGRMGGLTEVLMMPEKTSMADLREIARAYGIESAGGIELLKTWSRQPGRLRVLFKRLYWARKFAKEAGTDRITIDILKEANEHVPPDLSDEDEGGAK